MGLGGGGLALVVKLVADSSELVKGTDEGKTAVEGFGKSLDLGGIAKVAAFGAAAGVAVAAVAELTQAAIDDSAEQERLAAAYEAATGSTTAWTGAVDAAIAAGAEKAFTDTEIRDALIPLIGVTKDAEKANADLALAQDLARLKGIPLEQAALAIAKAHEGNTGALRKLVPQIDKNANATDALAQAQLAAKGQAERYGKSQKGQLESASIAFSELGETVGGVFLPVLDAILPVLKPLLGALGELIKAILPLLIPLLKIAAGALGIVAGAIVKVVNAVVRLITWLSKAIDKIGKFLSKLGPVKAAGDFIGGIIGGHAVSPATAAARAVPSTMAGQAGWAPSSGGVTIVAFGDPAVIESAVIRSLRRYDRRNGAAQVVPRWS